MVKDTLIDDHVSAKQCKLAINALHSNVSKFEEKRNEKDLLPGKEQHVWLNVSVKKIASAHTFKPMKIPIVHPLVDPRVSSVCLITKDPQRKYKDLLEENNVKFVSRVVGIEKLKGKFAPYEARRLLLKENDLFLADERIVPLLPKLLGKKWFEAKKQPIPVNITRKDIKGELERAISSTYMNQNQGTCSSIKIGKISQTPAQIFANLEVALPAIVARIKGGWDNIQSLLLKTNSSAGLPLWSCDLGDGTSGRWNGLVAQDEDEGSVAGEASSDEMEVVEEQKAKGKGKGKKRAAEEDEGNAVAPPSAKKKSKVAAGDAQISAPVPSPKRESVSKLSAKPASSKLSAPLTPDTPKANKSKPKSKPETASPAAAKKSRKPEKDFAAQTAEIASLLPAKEEPTKIADPSRKVQKKSADIVSTTPKKEKKSSSVESKKESKKEKTAAKTTPTEAPQLKSALISNDELKAKRAGKPGEKKKEKVVSFRGGKSAKAGLIGKKAGQ